MAEETRIETITVTVGQKKATSYSQEAFDANESITLTDTTAKEAGLLRKILRIKLMGSLVFDMIAFDSMISTSLVPEDVTTMVHISKRQLEMLTDTLTESADKDLPNKDLLVNHLAVAHGIIGDIEEQL